MNPERKRNKTQSLERKAEKGERMHEYVQDRGLKVDDASFAS
jgi:hypothetical protein